MYLFMLKVVVGMTHALHAFDARQLIISVKRRSRTR